MSKYKYIFFRIKEIKPKTKVYACLNKNSGIELGEVKWYAPWRQYCYFPTRAAIYSRGCFNDINDFITNLMEDRKNENNN